MDTKSKSFRHSMGAKLAAAVIVCICFVSALTSGFFLVYKNDTVRSKNYFESNQFKQEFARLIDNTVELQVKLKNEANVKASGQSARTISDELQRLYRIRDRLSTSVNFAYYLRNTGTGEVITNLKEPDALRIIAEQPTRVYFDRWGANVPIPLSDDIGKMLSGTQYEISAAVIEPLQTGDVFYQQLNEYNWVKRFMNPAIIMLGTSLVLLLMAFIYLVCVSGRREKGGEIFLSPIDSIYTDIFTLLVLAAAAASLIGVRYILINISGLAQIMVLASIVWGIDAVIGLTYILSLVRRAKKRQIIKSSLISKIILGLKQLIVIGFSGKIFKAWTLLLLLAYGAANGVLFIVIRNSSDDKQGLLLLLVFNAIVVLFAAKGLWSLTQIMAAVKEISAGNLDYPLDSTKVSAAFSRLAVDIQSIQGGLKKAVAEAVKGERMKTDLITNVSHDLKTPLTSIVNYVDLLKNEDLNNEKAKEYVQILEDKSSRLKQLIDDLFEASKVSSGNLSVSREKVDLRALVMQACGELEEKIKQADLCTVVNSTEKTTFIAADGSCMWRVIENLLTNALKYSMPHSRVYIDINQTDQHGSLVMKNISAFPLDITPDQMTERFVRGETSRTTEGSGLGLSIAKSLTNIQGGRFKIEIDGDLFKVTVEMPLWREE